MAEFLLQCGAVCNPYTFDGDRCHCELLYYGQLVMIPAATAWLGCHPMRHMQLWEPRSCRAEVKLAAESMPQGDSAVQRLPAALNIPAHLLLQRPLVGARRLRAACAVQMLPLPAACGCF